jgi:hypothetical protein
MAELKPDFRRFSIEKSVVQEHNPVLFPLIAQILNTFNQNLKPKLTLELALSLSGVNEENQNYENTIDSTDLNCESKIYLAIFDIVFRDLKSQPFWGDLVTKRDAYYHNNRISTKNDPKLTNGISNWDEENSVEGFIKGYRDFQSMGKKMQSFANYLIKGKGKDASYADLATPYIAYLSEKLKYLEAARKIAEILVYYPYSNLQRYICQVFEIDTSTDVSVSDILKVFQDISFDDFNQKCLTIDRDAPKLALLKASQAVMVRWEQETQAHPAIVSTSITETHLLHEETTTKRRAIILNSSYFQSKGTELRIPDSSSSGRSSPAPLSASIAHETNEISLEEQIQNEVDNVLLPEKTHSLEIGKFWSTERVKQEIRNLNININVDSDLKRSMVRFIASKAGKARSEIEIRYFSNMIQSKGFSEKLNPRLGFTTCLFFHEDLVLGYLQGFEPKIDGPTYGITKETIGKFQNPKVILQEIVQNNTNEPKEQHSLSTMLYDRIENYLAKLKVRCPDKVFYVEKRDVEDRKMTKFYDPELLKYVKKAIIDTRYKGFKRLTQVYATYKERLNAYNPPLRVIYNDSQVDAGRFADFVFDLLKDNPNLSNLIYRDESLYESSLICAPSLHERIIQALIEESQKEQEFMPMDEFYEAAMVAVNENRGENAKLSENHKKMFRFLLERNMAEAGLEYTYAEHDKINRRIPLAISAITLRDIQRDRRFWKGWIKIKSTREARKKLDIIDRELISQGIKPPIPKSLQGQERTEGHIWIHRSNQFKSVYVSKQAFDIYNSPNKDLKPTPTPELFPPTTSTSR